MLKVGKISSCVSTIEMQIPTGTLFFFFARCFFITYFNDVWLALVWWSESC